MAKPQAFVACRAVDTASTVAIVHAGGHELNPLLAKVIAHGWLPFIAIEGVVALVVAREEQHVAPTTRAAINAASCVPAIHNIAVLAR